MFNPKAIQDAFMGLVGMRQTNDPNFPQLAPILTKTGTNLIIQHPLLDIQNIDMTGRNYAEWTYDAWSGATTYAKYNRVMSAGKIYESLVDANLNNTPASSPAQWVEVNLLSLYLDDVYRASIDEVVNEVVNLKKLRREVKTLLRDLTLYEGVGSMNDLIVDLGDLVGFEIKLKHSRNLIAVIEKVGTQFSDVGEMTLWVYNSSQKEAIGTITINRAKPYSFEWTSTALTLNHHGQYGAGGVYYIMYDQSSSAGQALNMRMTIGKAPCGSCSPYNENAFNTYSKYMTIRAVRVKAADRQTVLNEPDTLWNIDKNIYEEITNYGLNLSLSVRCDLTEFLIAHKEVFSFAVRDMITLKLLEGIANSTRQNSIEATTKSMALIAIQNGNVGGGGMKQQVDKQLKAVDFEFSGFNDYCLPCNNQNGLTYGAVSLNY